MPSPLPATARTQAGGDSTFIGVKGVNTQWSHGDLDGGSFVYTHGGARFATDLGKDYYFLPNYGTATASGI